ncbi:MAG: PsbP-related protein [Patescibacteria group bacterium]|jgi:hypothetical protein
MKKILILFPILALLIAGCSLTQKPVVDNSASNQPVSLSQEQANNLNAQVQDLKKQNGELLKENEAIKTNSANQNSNSSIIPNQTNTDWQTYHNEKYGYEVKYPADWKIFGSSTSTGVAFGKNNQDPNNDGELFINIDTNRSAARVISDQELTEKDRAGHSIIKKLPVVINGLAGTLLVITNSELEKNIPTWEFNIVVVERNQITYVLSNGAVKSNNFEEFYKSFRFR